MQIVSNFHKMSNPVFWENYEKSQLEKLSSAEFAQFLVKVKTNSVVCIVWRIGMSFNRNMF